MSTTTPNLGLTLPTPNVDTGWGGTLNTDFTLIDNLFTADGSGTSVGLQVGAGKTLNVGGTIVAGGTVILGSGDGTGTVTAPTIRGAAKTGTNAVGDNLVIDALNGTGTGGSGSIIFRTAPASGTPGTTANTMAIALEIKNSGIINVGGRSVNYFMPSGAVMPYAGSTEPTGWIFCYGQAVSRATYADLFAAIGTTYGVGDGSTTFNLPDLRGRAVAGRDDMGGSAANRLTTTTMSGSVIGSTGGSQTQALTVAQLPAHGHPMRLAIQSATPASSQATGGLLMSVSGATSFSAYSGTVSNTAGQQIGGTGNGGAHNNVQPTFILNYIIKT